MPSTITAQGRLTPFIRASLKKGDMGIEKRGSSTELLLRTAIEQSPLATAILDPDGRYLLVNAAWNALWPRGEYGFPESSSVFENERLRVMGLAPYIEECRQNGEVTTPILFCEATPETRPRWLKAFIYPVRDETGALLQVGLVFEDFTERKALEDQLAHQAFHDSLKQDLSAPFEVDGHQAVVTSSIGVVVAAPGETGEYYAEELMRRADIAMYRSKREGKNRHEIFSFGMNHSLERLRLEEDLRRAIERGELRVYYQPQILMSTGETVGFEALVRWEHPERGLLAPSEFISLAEETGMIIPLGQWVLTEACHQVRIFREQIPPEASLRMSVNLSAPQFRHPELVEEFAAILSETGTDSRDVVLEITESVMMEKGPNARRILRALKGLGLTLAMDDFGTGYSSITTLRNLPVDILKLDRSMVEGMDRDPQDRALVSATIGLAHALALDVVVEGVETAGELDELRSMGCDIAQGYYWYGPCPSEKATELLVS